MPQEAELGNQGALEGTTGASWVTKQLSVEVRASFMILAPDLWYSDSKVG